MLLLGRARPVQLSGRPFRGRPGEPLQAHNRGRRPPLCPSMNSSGPLITHPLCVLICRSTAPMVLNKGLSCPDNLGSRSALVLLEPKITMHANNGPDYVFPRCTAIPAEERLDRTQKPFAVSGMMRLSPFPHESHQRVMMV
jgi:hypothetical protein